MHVRRILQPLVKNLFVADIYLFVVFLEMQIYSHRFASLSVPRAAQLESLTFTSEAIRTVIHTISIFINKKN